MLEIGPAIWGRVTWTLNNLRIRSFYGQYSSQIYHRNNYDVYNETIVFSGSHFNVSYLNVKPW